MLIPAAMPLAWRPFSWSEFEALPRRRRTEGATFLDFSSMSPLPIILKSGRTTFYRRHQQASAVASRFRRVGGFTASRATESVSPF